MMNYGFTYFYTFSPVTKIKTQYEAFQRSQMVLLCTVRPEAEFIAQTLATVRFASRAARIPISEPKVNSTPDPISKMNELAGEVKSLKKRILI